MPQTQRFDLQRKIISCMTSAGWRESPHVAFLYEPEVAKLLEVLNELNEHRDAPSRITLNTVMMKIIAEAVKAAPAVNSHIRYHRRSECGELTSFSNVDVTMPVLLESDGTVVLKVRGVEQKSLTEIQSTVADLFRRLGNTHLQQAMYEVSLHDTLTELKHFHLLRAMARFLGFWLEGGPKTLLHGAEKRAYLALPATERLTRQDMDQGTIMITNPGALFRHLPLCTTTMMVLVPPQVTGISIGTVQQRPVVGADGTVRAGKVLPLSIVCDHRALDAADFVPFIERIDRIMQDPAVLRDWV